EGHAAREACRRHDRRARRAGRDRAARRVGAVRLARAGGRGVRRGVRAGVLAGNGAPGRLVAAPAELDRLDLRSAELPRRWRRVEPGSVHPTPLPPAAVSSRTRELAPAGGGAARQILFGDLHVHTTFSSDAFQLSLPLLQGEGAHPPADACDFARFCSGLDFWSITDHAESITPRRWQETKDTIRRCDAVAGGPDGPDVVPFVGWEWTQVGVTPEDHYGHKNVILRNLEDASLPARPIAATGRFARVLRYGIIASRSWWDRVRFPLLDFRQRQRYLDLGVLFAENRAVPDCPRGIDTRQLPADCYETADTPQELFEKLSQWGFDVIVIPHGTTWGLYTP